MDLPSSHTDEHLTSGVSRPIIPLFKKLWRSASFISFNSLRRSLVIIHAILLWFLLLISPRHRLPHSSPPSSLSAPVSKPSYQRLVSRRSEEDTLRRRSLAEGLEVVSDAVTVGCITSLFFGPRCNALFYRSWFPVSNDIRAILIVIHGLNEHSGRYSHFAHQLTACNFGVYAMDWIGHGGSDGLHGYVPSLDHVVADTGAFLEKVKSENPGVPCFFLGHSTGGAIVLKAALYPHIEKMLEGVLLTSPALRVNPTHPIVKAVAPLFSLIIPTFQIKGANRRGIPVSRDPAALQAKYSDPLVYTGQIRVRTGHEILRMSSHLLQNLKSVTVPFLVLHGTADRVTDPFASLDLYREAASEFKDIMLYDGFFHDLLFEPERDQIGRDIINWMDNRLAANVNHFLPNSHG